MKKIILIITFIILAAISFRVLTFQKFNSKNIVTPITEVKSDVRNTTYTIDNNSITLVNGIAKSEVASGSASQITTRYFGNEATGDLNGDGISDTALILTQDMGGSGTFYYVTVALAKGSEFKGLNAILLGDRIAPQTTEIKDEKIIVNYADRKIDEPMTVVPSVGISKYFEVINNNLIETKN